MPVLPGAEPFNHDGSTEAGVLLCHGFTGSPQSMRPWGEELAKEGFTVRCPRLPGHGTSWQEMNRTTFADWYDCVDAAFTQLAAECESTFVFGLSMGGTLCLRLAQRHGAAVAGITLVNPSIMSPRLDMKLLPVISRVIPSVPGIGCDIAQPGTVEQAYTRTPLRAANSLRAAWKHVRADLPAVTQPLLLFRSAVDHVVDPVNSRIVLASVRSPDITDVVLRNSYHVATLDADAPLIFAGSVEFTRRVHAARAERQVT